jgi:sodium transport system ATP-binding protein
LRDAGKCLIFSTHIMSEVERLCDRIAIMHRGRILDTGSLEDLRTRHNEHDFEELFFGLLSRHEQAERDQGGAVDPDAWSSSIAPQEQMPTSVTLSPLAQPVSGGTVS